MALLSNTPLLPARLQPTSLLAAVLLAVAGTAVAVPSPVVAHLLLLLLLLLAPLLAREPQHGGMQPGPR